MLIVFTFRTAKKVGQIILVIFMTHGWLFYYFTSLTFRSLNLGAYESKIMASANKLHNTGFKVVDEWLDTLLVLSSLVDWYQLMIIATENLSIK